MPFERLVEVLNPARSLARHPLFQVMLAFQNNAPARFEVPGLAARFEPVAVGRAKFDLSVSVSERRGEDGAACGIVGEIEYAADLFERGTVEGLAGRLVRLLAGAVAHPDCPIGRLELLGGEERESILAGWNATAREVLPGSLPCLFAAQAGKRPDATAVVFERGRLSYGELDRRSNQLAHHLRGLGVGPETVVGLCLERSLELIVGLLGILKAGGAYLPLDPQYPAGEACLHAGGCGSARAGHAGSVAGSAGSCQCKLARRRGAAGCGCGGDCRAAHARSAARARPPPPRLCHLHLGLNRHPQRCHRYP